jgi:hypothetical protein
MLRRHYTSLAFWAATKHEALLIANVESEAGTESPQDAIPSLDAQLDLLPTTTTDESGEMREAA